MNLCLQLVSGYHIQENRHTFADYAMRLIVQRLECLPSMKRAIFRSYYNKLYCKDN